mmetsp:Transcript_28788/g.45339  ORF Transcript_28788/g.45339 Transcript_28788/m.45339 type:complete len:448 (+) Transcript_28788:96-1439(+)
MHEIHYLFIMIPSNSSLNAALQTVAVGVILYWWMRRRSEPNEQAKPLHVDYGEATSLPFPMKVIASLPEWIRIPLMIKAGKPSPPRDSIDVLGQDSELDPYDKKVILPGKIWSVRYCFLTHPDFKKVAETLFGINQQAAITNAPDHLKETLQTDFITSEKFQAMSEKERAEQGGDAKHDMFIAKINVDGIENALLIFNPVRLHPQMIDWINELGEVKFIVSGSASHTNFLPAAAKQFPDAKIICASAADLKCQGVGMRPADFLYDVVRGEVPKSFIGRGTYEDAVEALQGQARLFHIRGDVCTQALLVLVHKHLFEVDLLYVPSDEKLREIEFESGTSILHSTHRIFYYSLITRKAHPYDYLIPKYRCLMMDPTALFATKLMIDAPKADGTSVIDMTVSLRKAMKELSQDGVCDQVLSVHALEMSRECFCQRIDETWGWLDGRSFLE